MYFDETHANEWVSKDAFDRYYLSRNGDLAKILDKLKKDLDAFVIRPNLIKCEIKDKQLTKRLEDEKEVTRLQQSWEGKSFQNYQIHVAEEFKSKEIHVSKKVTTHFDIAKDAKNHLEEVIKGVLRDETTTKQAAKKIVGLTSDESESTPDDMLLLEVHNNKFLIWSNIQVLPDNIMQPDFVANMLLRSYYNCPCVIGDVKGEGRKDDTHDYLVDLILAKSLTSAYKLSLAKQSEYAFSNDELYFKVSSHFLQILKQYPEYLQARTKNMTEGNYTMKVWGPVIEAVFDHPKLKVMWGESVNSSSSEAKKIGCTDSTNKKYIGDKVDFRICYKNNDSLIDLMSGEVGKLQTDDKKYHNDHAKIAREGKLAAIEGEILEIRLADNGLYAVPGLGSLRLPKNKDDVRRAKKLLK
ncbi:hypothetical protein INT48_001550, partial [Thamnidium elegans]